MSGKITEQLTTEGEFVAAYKSAYLANVLSSVPYSTIKHAINGRKSRAYTWKEVDTRTLRGLARRKNTIAQRDLETGELVAVFTSVTQAARMNGFDQSAVSKVVNGVRKSIYGYSFS